MDKIYTFSNGLTLIVDTNKSVPTAAVQVVFKVGAVNETQKELGISHFLEHMLFTGTEKRTGDDIKDEFRKYNAFYNGSTGLDSTRYYIEVVKKYFEHIFEVLTDMLNNSSFKEEELQRERNVVIDELVKLQDNDQRFFTREFFKFYYKDTVLEKDVIGTIESLKSITRQDIIDYFNKYYVPNNCVISFAGNITFKKAKRLVMKYFDLAKMPNEQVETYALQKANYFPKRNVFTLNRDKKQVSIKLVFPALTKLDENYDTIVILSSLIANKLYKILRNKSGIIYSLNAGINYCYNASMLFIDFSTNEEHVKDALKLIITEIKNVKKHGFLESELSNEILRREIALITFYNNPTKVATYNAFEYIESNEIKSVKEKFDTYKKITNQQLIELANIIFDNKHVNFGILSKNMNADVFKSFKI